MEQLELFDEFQEVPAKVWKQKIQYELRGADYNEKLVWESPEGIKVKPFYHKEDLANSVFGPPKQPISWSIAQEIFVADAAKANKKAKDILGRGAESLIFKIPSEKIDITILCEDLAIETVPLHFNFGFLSVSYIEKVLREVGRSTSPIYLHIDTIGHLTATGNWFSHSKDNQGAIKKILELSRRQKSVHALGADLAVYQNSGANMVQQLAYGMAHMNEYLNAFGYDLVGKPVFKVAVGSHYFFEISKIRALRILWKTLAEAYGATPDCHILATPSKRNMTLYGYNTNMLRTLTECMSAILGGADTVYNLPYDSIFRKDNEFAERMARNQLVLLKNESYFDEIDDPAKGCYYIESVTRQLAEKALLLFKNIEANGGFLKQLKNGTIQKKIAESAKKEQQRFDTKNNILVGTNAYQSSLDKMNDQLERYPFMKKKRGKTLIEPIIERRLAEKEELARLQHEGWKPT